jgi:acetylornithine deacetylase
MKPAALAADEVVGLLRDLIRIPSVNPSLAPGERGGEGAIASFIAEWLEARGIKGALEEAAPGRPNVTAVVGAGRGPTLVLCGHIDTVGTAGMTIEPFEPRVENGRVYGRGSYDMKCGVAAVLAAGAALQETGVAGTVTLALLADEEYTSLGAEEFAKRHRGDGCILAEPTEGALVIAHKGFVWATVRTRGRAAHGSRWDIGRSAIGAMGRIVAALEEFDGTVLRSRTDPLVGPASMHCALIQGGAGITTYAPECELKIERRTLPGETPESVLNELNRVVARAGESAEVTLDFARPPLACDPGSSVVRSVRGAAASAAGSPPREIGVAYWTDAAVFASAGIPSVIYGPSGAGAHEAVEWAETASVVRCAEVLFESARRFCSDG